MAIFRVSPLFMRIAGCSAAILYACLWVILQDFAVYVLGLRGVSLVADLARVGALHALGLLTSSRLRPSARTERAVDC